MSVFGVYEDDMLKRKFSDQDIERLLSGQRADDGDLASLAPILESLHRSGWRAPSEEKVAAFAVQAAGIAGSTKSLAPPERTPIRPRLSQSAPRRGLVKTAAGLLLLFGVSGVAVASDEAAPGDALYGLDRALEAVGVNDGAASERIREARALFDRGHEADAVTHVADAIEEAEPDPELRRVFLRGRAGGRSPQTGSRQRPERQ